MQEFSFSLIAINSHTEKNPPVEYNATGTLIESIEDIFEALGLNFKIILIPFDSMRFQVAFNGKFVFGVILLESKSV